MDIRLSRNPSERGRGERYVAGSRKPERAISGPVWSYFRIGELDSAVSLGHDAVTEISTLSSKRAYARLKTLAETAAPFEHDSGVAELRERIRDALATAA